ncbi:1-acyl-sn-glycerol-3-phosphate acyltransferase [Acholeplasma vituli]|uniref:1-acyl-sn-glycerol-3-phosphate acyltransferase n=1 Tax=Paracholeplasma vituli TaxID=69473 RepID=A0ABT2PTS3_9MOLU|nr:lysophospholipid acyltransferase family protein [Paracholeplasma vituli]MCU0104350.1 1-acyl-sn-glycerol-3-phosphate acyltransferase [Paracholeplasma vituli]
MKKRFRHVLLYTLLRPFFRLFVWIKFRFIGKKYKGPAKGPYLVLGNHTINEDLIMVALSFREPIYFVASDMLFSIPIISKIIYYIVQPISKAKYKPDPETVKNMIRVARSGGSIGIFPEGNRTFSGKIMYMPYSIAKLIKLLKLPVLFYRLEGGYLSHPRWAKKHRRGKMRGYVSTTWTYEEYKDLSNDEIYQRANKELAVNDFDMQAISRRRFRGKNYAEYIERAFFISPETNQIGTIYSDKDDIFDHSSKLHYRMNKYGLIDNLGNTKHYPNTIEWYEHQVKVVDRLVDERVSTPLFEEDAHAFELLKRKQIPLSPTQLVLYTDRFTFTIKDEVQTWYYQDILPAVQYSNTLIVYHKNLEKTYFFRGNERFNALKYVMFAKSHQRRVLNYDSEL